VPSTTWRRKSWQIGANAQQNAVAWSILGSFYRRGKNNKFIRQLKFNGFPTAAFVATTRNSAHP
jgi:hypothetical protein